jgi:hypothetical protein
MASSAAAALMLPATVVATFELYFGHEWLSGALHRLVLLKPVNMCRQPATHRGPAAGPAPQPGAAQPQPRVGGTGTLPGFRSTVYHPTAPVYLPARSAAMHVSLSACLPICAGPGSLTCLSHSAPPAKLTPHHVQQASKYLSLQTQLFVSLVREARGLDARLKLLHDARDLAAQLPRGALLSLVHC